MALFKPKVLLRPFKDKKGRRLYGQDDTYTTYCKNAVKLLKGELSDNCLQSKCRISIPFPVQPVFYKPSRGVDRKTIELFKYHDNFIYCAHMRGDNSSYNKIHIKNEHFITVDYMEEDSGDSDSSNDSDDHSSPLNLKNHQEV